MKRFVLALVVGALAVGTASVPAAAANRPPTIVGIASSNPAFSTLTAAVVCTGLAPTLNGRARYTVFAPTDAAFASLGLNASNVCSALPHSTLKNILLYHVTPGTRYSASVLPRHSNQLRTIETLLDDQAFQVNSQGVIRTSSGGTSQIVQPNIAASNGVIHVINAVLIPGAAMSEEDD